MAVKFTRLDLNYILTQIEMAEAGQPRNRGRFPGSQAVIAA